MYNFKLSDQVQLTISMGCFFETARNLGFDVSSDSEYSLSNSGRMGVNPLNNLLKPSKKFDSAVKKIKDTFLTLSEISMIELNERLGIEAKTICHLMCHGNSMSSFGDSYMFYPAYFADYGDVPSLGEPKLVQSWVDENDGKFDLLSICCCNAPFPADLKSRKSILHYPVDRIEFFEFIISRNYKTFIPESELIRNTVKTLQ